MSDLSSFCAEFGLEESAAAEALEKANAAHAPTMPWYVQSGLAGMAWLAALAIIGFCVVLVGMSAGSDMLGTLGLIGVLIFIAGLILPHGAENTFKAQLHTAMGSAGMTLAAASIGMEADTAWAAALTAAVLTAIALKASAANGFLFLGTLLTIATSLLAVAIWEPAMTPLATSLLMIPGALLLIIPPRRDARPLAHALLLCTPLALTVMENRHLLGSGPDMELAEWIARGILVGLSLWLVWLIRQRVATTRARNFLILLAIAIVGIACLLPPAGSAAMALLLLAFLLGHRLLAIAGVLLQGYFIVRYYYLLDTSLLIKSLLLMAAGAVLLALWAALHRKMPEGTT